MSQKTATGVGIWNKTSRIFAALLFGTQISFTTAGSIWLLIEEPRHRYIDPRSDKGIKLCFSIKLSLSDYLSYYLYSNSSPATVLLLYIFCTCTIICTVC